MLSGWRQYDDPVTSGQQKTAVSAHGAMIYTSLARCLAAIAIAPPIGIRFVFSNVVASRLPSPMHVNNTIIPSSNAPMLGYDPGQKFPTGQGAVSVRMLTTYITVERPVMLPTARK